VDFLLATKRDLDAAQRFFREMLVATLLFGRM
jgi:transposase-like protein